jgi:hypothetical protein
MEQRRVEMASIQRGMQQGAESAIAGVVPTVYLIRDRQVG